MVACLDTSSATIGVTETQPPALAHEPSARNGRSVAPSRGLRTMRGGRGSIPNTDSERSREQALGRQGPTDAAGSRGWLSLSDGDEEPACGRHPGRLSGIGRSTFTPEQSRRHLDRVLDHKDVVVES
jgi:hypothetical protein